MDHATYPPNRPSNRPRADTGHPGAVAEVAAASPSSAWFLSVVGIHNWQLGLFPDEAQHDVWGSDTSILISSSYAPTGKVELHPGGTPPELFL
jgi:hypothetical protein